MSYKDPMWIIDKKRTLIRILQMGCQMYLGSVVWAACHAIMPLLRSFPKTPSYQGIGVPSMFKNVPEVVVSVARSSCSTTQTGQSKLGRASTGVDRTACSGGFLR